MKTTLFLSALWLALASFFTPAEQAILTGKVRDESGEALVGVSIKVFKDRDPIRGSITDYDGHYKLLLDPGTYNVEVSYTGYETIRFADVVLLAGKTHTLDAKMAAPTTLSEVVITTYKVPLIEQDKTSGAKVLSPEKSDVKALKKSSAKTAKSAPESKSKPEKETESAMRAAPTKPVVYTPAAGEAKPMPSAPPAETPTETPAPADDIVIVNGRKMRMVIPFDPETYEEKVVLVDVEDEIIAAIEAGSNGVKLATETIDEVAPGTITQPKPKAGLLTAGEWNDLHNWNRHWSDLITDGEIAPYEDMYGFFAHDRYTVMLTNELDFPLADVAVQLKNDGQIIWEARTDNTGKAELWSGLYDKKTFSNLKIEALVNGKKKELGKPKPAKEGYNFFKIKADCFAPTNVDIVWAVDATGSMGDEIEYLKTEVLDVIARAKTNNPALAFRMGTAFYRDKGDEYIVKSSALSPDINRTVEFIQHQFAGGGGDYPEAVHSALEDVVYNQKWSENAIARICFLVLDASPHQDPAVKESLQKTIRAAARLGIRIVPLAASGIQKDTEFLMKFFGLATNGTYVFLTDHSGIGGKHLEPTTDEYKVEPLNDLLVRIITEYTSIETCEGKSNIRFENDPQQQPGETLQATYYPNPASEQFTLELPFELPSVTLYDSEGKGVRKLEKLQAGPNTIPVNDLPPGFYTIRILNNGRMQSGKLMVVR